MDPQEKLRHALAEALQRAFPGIETPTEGQIQLTPPRQREHGDLATNVAMSLAKTAGKPPRAIAEAIVKQMEGHESIEAAEIAGPGFINFRLSHGAATEVLHRIASAGEAYGNAQFGDSVRVNVEFVSANPTGPLHVGHARGAVVGDTVCRLLEATGHGVTREFYFNDAGVQMNTLGASLAARILQESGEGVSLPEDGYHGEYLIPVAQRALRELPDAVTIARSDDHTAITQFGAEEIMGWIKRDLHALGIDFDVFTLERSIHESGAVQRAMEELQRRGELYESEGAMFLRTEKYGDEKDRVVIKSDGNFTYLAPDIAYHRDKYERGFQRIIDVLGADHHGYVPRLKAACQALGHDIESIEVVIIQMVNILKEGEVQRLGKRLGNFITLEEMIRELGADVVRWFFLMRSADSDMTFDWDLAKDRSDRNPVFKVQYAHARVCSVFRQGKNRGIEFAGVENADLSLLKAEEEQALLSFLTQFPSAVEKAARTLSPHIIPTHLLELANLYNSFQTLGRQSAEFRILRPDAPAETQARLALIDGVRQVLRNGLTLMGIDAPEQM